MALTELQLPTKDQFYNVIRHAATEMDNLMVRWKSLAELLANFETADLDAMGVPTGQVRTDLVDFRVAVNEIIALYEGGSVTPVNPPNSVMDKCRQFK